MPAHLFHMITAMEPYRGGSFEELRMLDYQQGRKEPTAQPAQPATTGFGQTTGGFGSTSGGFGQPAASTSTFGAPKPGGLFGSTGNTAGGFGTSSGGFGAQANTGGGLFGQTNTASTGFGAQNTNTGGGLFGQNNQQQQQPATGGGLFGNSNPFGQNNQQQQQQPATTGFGGFGATANKPAFGATTTGGFGTGSGTNTFGQTNTTGTTTGFGGFGQQQNQQQNQTTGGGLFGSGSGGFGQTNTQTNTGGGLFGQQNTQQQPSGGLFGNTAAAKPGGLFGSTTTPAATTGFGGFGQTNTNTTQPSTGLFGQTNTAATTNTGGGLFGQQQQAQPAATGGLFGSTNTATTGGGLFGAKPATTTGGGLFGSTPAQPAQPATTGFGSFGQNTTAAPAAGGGLFGASTAATAPKPSLFGGGGGSLFGQQQQQQQPAATGGGLFGGLGQSTTAAQPTTSLFGSTAQPQQQSTLGQSGGLFGSTLGQSTLGQQQQQPSLTASVDQNPYGRNDLFQYSGQKLELGSTNKKPALPPLTASSYRPSPSKGSRLTKLRGFATSSVNGSTSSPRASSPGPNSPRNSLSLVGSPVPSDRYKGLTDSALSPNAFIPRPNVKKITIAPPRSTMNGGGDDHLESVLGKSALRSSANGGSAPATPELSARSPVPIASSSRQAIEDTPTRRPAQLESSTMRVAAAERALKKGDYWCRPKLEKLKAMSHDQLSNLSDFTVGRKGYGEVTFLRPVDLTSVSSLNDLLGGIVVVESLELTVYPDETDKPPRGKGMNVPAEISLENVWARDKATRQPVTDPSDPRYKRQLKRIQAVPETEFIGFKDGVWTFRVEHFSRYGLDASDDETDDDEGVGSPTPDKSKSPEDKSPSVYSDEDEDFFPPTKSLYDVDNVSDEHDSGLDETSEMSYDDEDEDMDASAEYDDDYEDELRAYRTIKSKLGAQGMQRMREMQSAFFGAQETKSKRPTLAEQKANEIRQALERKRAEAGFDDAEEGVARLDDRAVKRASFGESSRPPQLRQPRKYAKVPLDQSFVAGNEGVRPDAGLALGRSFRCSWGPNGELVHMGKICSPSTEFESSPDAVVYVQQVDLLAEPQAAEQARADRLLSLLLEYTEVDVDDNSIPEAITNTDIRFRDFAKLFDSGDRSHEANLWRLGQALFDEIDLKLPPSTPSDVSNRVAEMRRKLALSKWLEDAVAPAMDADLVKAGDDRPAKVFALLTGNRTDRAMQSALDGSDLRLATLVSQAGSSDEFRAEVRRQLDDWTKYKSNSLIGYTYRKIYALLAGIPDVSQGNPERGADHAPDVIVNENLDWKRAFGLYLWHGCPFELGVADVLEQYTEALSSSHPPSKPLPPYLEQPDANNRWEMPTEPTDVLFNLIKMYADRTLALEDVVTSRDCGASPTDVRLPWHISFLLSQALQRRDFADREDADESGTRYSATANQMTESYAAQLEEEGQWTWAAYVLLHLAYAESRRVALKALLFRHPEPTPAEQMFLVDKLRIPREWLHEARAAHLAAQGNAYSEYKDLIPAGLADRAQRTLVTKLAPEAVLREDSALLRRLCQELEPLQPEGWEYGGKLFLDYLEIRARVKPLLAAARRSGAHPDPREASELRQLADNIPRVLQLLPSLFPDRTDVQQVASLSNMLGTLQALASDLHCAGYMPRPPVSDLLLDKDRLHLLQESATESFDKSLQALVA
jgi:nuclear pore complex protein Nup98-Nup96